LSTRLRSTCPVRIDLSSSHPRHLTRHLAAHRVAIGSRWRRLSAGRQALLALAHLRCGHTYAQPAAGFGVGIATVYRHVTKAVAILAALAPDLATAARAASAKAFLILDGTLLPIDPWEAMGERAGESEVGIPDFPGYRGSDLLSSRIARNAE
jgi:hypothetical protein